MTIRIAGVSCSRRAESYTRRAVRYALATARNAGAETDFIDLGDVDLPLYHPDLDEQGESAALKRRVRQADGVLIGSPVYHGSYSSTFRNFHDYCGWDEYEDTTVGLIAVAGGGSYASTLDHLRITVRGVHGYVVPEQVGIRNASDKFEDDRPIDEDIADRLESLGEEVVTQARYRMLPTKASE